MHDEFLSEALGLNFDGSELITTSGPVITRLCIILAFAVLGARIASRAVRKVDDPRTRRQLEFFAPKLVRVLVLAGGLEVAGIDVTGMAALLTTIGFTGAVIFTPIGQNVVAGVVATLDDVFSIGDVVEVDGTWGTVLSRSLLRIEIGRVDGTTVWVPNSAISEQSMLNYSRLGGYRIEIEIPLDHNPDRQLAHNVMADVLAKVTWSVAGREPMICFDRVSDAATLFRVYVWISDRTQEPARRSELLTDLVFALEDAGLSVGHTTNLSTHAATPLST